MHFRFFLFLRVKVTKKAQNYESFALFYMPIMD